MEDRQEKNPSSDPVRLEMLQRAFPGFCGIVKLPNADCAVCGGAGIIDAAQVYGVAAGRLPCQCTRLRYAESVTTAYSMASGSVRPKQKKLAEYIICAHGGKENLNANLSRAEAEVSSLGQNEV